MNHFVNAQPVLNPWEVPCSSIVQDSVADPDPHVFGPPGSGSTSQRYGSGSGSFYHHAKIVRKALISTILRLFLTFYLWKKLKIVLKIFLFSGILKVNDENNRIRIIDPDRDPLVRGMDPRIRIRIHPKMSWISNTGWSMAVLGGGGAAVHGWGCQHQVQLRAVPTPGGLLQTQ